MKRFFLNILLVLSCLFLTTLQSYANIKDYMPHKMTVEVNNDISSENPPQSFSVVVNNNYKFNDNKEVEKGTKIYLELLDVSEPKIGKRDAYIEARIKKVYTPSNNKTANITNNKAIVKISKYEKLDIADKAADVGITVANQFVKNITYPLHFAKGVVENKEDNRLKSGAKEVYDSSLLSYTSKGESLELQAGELATLTFYTKSTNSSAE